MAYHKSSADADNAAPDDVSLGLKKEHVLNFEGIDTSQTGGFANIPNGYGYLDWSNLYAVNPHRADLKSYGPNGFLVGVTSGHQAIYSPADHPTSSVYIVNGTFSLESVNMTAAWNSKESVKIEGLDHDGNVLYEKKVDLTDQAPKTVSFHWDDLARVTFIFNDNGKQDPKTTGRGHDVVFDDMAIANLDMNAAGASPKQSGADAQTHGSIGAAIHDLSLLHVDAHSFVHAIA